MNDEMKGLHTPAVVINLDTVERNIKLMVESASEYGLFHRPHIKTHRCSELAKLQIAAGCCGITVAKLGEAEVMADAGIEDIFVAYPIIGQDKIERIIALAKQCHISTAVNSFVGAKMLSDAFHATGLKLNVLIEVDGGLNRGGVKPGITTLEFAHMIENLPGISIRGLMYYGGLVYNSHSIEEVRQFARKEKDELIETAAFLQSEGFNMEVLSAGSSFTGRFPQELCGITEIRSGHYIFNDRGQLDIGFVTPKDCALTVVSTIVSKSDEHTVIADVGTKSLTSDTCHHCSGYGYIKGYPYMEIYSLNEEHAFIRSEHKNTLEIGDKIEIIPNHACVVTNMVEEAYGFSHGKLDHMLKIDARGKSV